MTEEQVKRANALLQTREEIMQFLTARVPESPFVKGYLDSKYEHQREEGKQLPDAEVAQIAISDAKSVITAYDEEPQSLAYWYISRDVLERALQAELPRIDDELAVLGVDA